jgi:hypothetical protein
MAGLAAALNAPGRIDALRDGLAPRGADAATLHLDGFDGAGIDLAVRAALPAIPRVVSDAGTDHARVVAGLAVDGIASVTALDAGYATRGPDGLFGGDEPYAVIMADAEHDCLVLARNGDGPGLYYARYEGGWLAASEPIALVRAGIPADPDPDTVARFIQTGASDDTRHTFLQQIRRVRAGEAVVLAADGSVEPIGEPAPSRGTNVAVALETAVADGRVGVLLGPGRPGAALLGAALSRPDRLRPLPVHTVDREAGRPPALLLAMDRTTLRHYPHEFDVRGLDLDAFLTEVGEPVPDLDLYLVWAVARTLGGEIDVLVDASGGARAPVSRVRDRIEARYGVVVRTPMRDTGPVHDRVLQSLVDISLPAPAARTVAVGPSATVTAAEVLLGAPEPVAAALARPRPWSDRTALIDSLRRLTAGEPVDADLLLRAYLVERWLDTLPAPEPEPEADLDEPPGDLVPAQQGNAEPSKPEHAAPAESKPVQVKRATLVPPPEEVRVAGLSWSRLRVRTEVFVPGDAVVAKAAWHAANALADLSADRSAREALRGPWFAILSGRALAVTQRRACPLWDIKPGPAARWLSRIARRRLPHLGEAWTMQVALTESDRTRVAAAVLVARVWPRRGARMLPDPAASLYPPRAGAVPPGDSAVVRGPVQSDQTAAALVGALRYAAPMSLVATLAGCAVVSADENGCRLLGFAAGPYADAVPDAESVVSQLCVDNPAGQNHEQTPVLLAYAAPRWQAADNDQERLDFHINAKPTVDRREADQTTPSR